MRRINFIAILLTIFTILPLSAKKYQDEWGKYEINGAGTGNQGTYLVEVYVTTKNKNLSESELKSAAVHGVLFRGFSDASSRKTQKPLAGSAANEAQHADFYNEFFSKDGTSSNYANIIPGSRKITKVGKEYKISAVVSVNKENLLKYLQDVGVVKGLNSIF